MATITLSAIVAMAQNRVIGINNKLPWYLPADLQHFKRTTMGKPIIMGRLTYESIGKPLPGRANIVVSRNSSLRIDGVTTCTSLADAISKAEAHCTISGVDEAVVIGGEQLYRLALPHLDRLYLTEVMATVEGDAWFPDFDRQQWRESSNEFYAAEGPNPFDYRLIQLDRIQSL